MELVTKIARALVTSHDYLRAIDYYNKVRGSEGKGQAWSRHRGRDQEGLIGLVGNQHTVGKGQAWDRWGRWGRSGRWATRMKEQG